MKKLIIISFATISLVSWSQNANDKKVIDTVISSEISELSSELIMTKNFYKEENTLILDYNYPYMDEQRNPLFANFNSFLKDTYLETEASIGEVLNNKDLSCDPLVKDAKRNRRNIDYKIYDKNDQLLSVLLYKTNYYDYQHHYSFMFKGLNYDLKTGKFITYSDLFKSDSEGFVLSKLNHELKTLINSKDSFNDCWELTSDKFQLFKDNFVMDSEYIKFYFDDCTVCPTYSGNYFLKISLKELSTVLTS